MHEILSDFDSVKVYKDDVIVPGPTREGYGCTLVMSRQSVDHGPATSKVFFRAWSLIDEYPCTGTLWPKQTHVSADASSYYLRCVFLQQRDDTESLSLTAPESLKVQKVAMLRLKRSGDLARWTFLKIPNLHGAIQAHNWPQTPCPLNNTKDLDTEPIRCQQLLLRLMRFDATA